METANPALRSGAFTQYSRVDVAQGTMSIQGTVNKTSLLLLFVVLTAAWTWSIFFQTGSPQAVVPLLMVGVVGGLIVGLATVFKPFWAAVTAPIYALLEGLVIGVVSCFAEAQFPGIVVQAVGLTFGTCLVLLLAYKSGLIRATERFKLGVVAATGGILLVYVISFILGWFRIGVPFIYGSSAIGIGVSLFVCIIAALNLVLDFDLIETNSAQGAPRYMEWYGAFALMVTLIWLYLEIIRLLTKLRSRE